MDVITNVLVDTAEQRCLQVRETKTSDNRQPKLWDLSFDRSCNNLAVEMTRLFPSGVKTTVAIWGAEVETENFEEVAGEIRLKPRSEEDEEKLTIVIFHWEQLEMERGKSIAHGEGEGNEIWEHILAAKGMTWRIEEEVDWNRKRQLHLAVNMEKRENLGIRVAQPGWGNMKHLSDLWAEAIGEEEEEERMEVNSSTAAFAELLEQEDMQVARSSGARRNLFSEPDVEQMDGEISESQKQFLYTQELVVSDSDEELEGTGEREKLEKKKKKGPGDQEEVIQGLGDRDEEKSEKDVFVSCEESSEESGEEFASASASPCKMRKLDELQSKSPDSGEKGAANNWKLDKLFKKGKDVGVDGGQEEEEISEAEAEQADMSSEDNYRYTQLLNEL